MACATRYTVRVFDKDGTEYGRFGPFTSQVEALEAADGLILPGDHARVYDATGAEVGRSYAGWGDDIDSL